MCEELEGDVGTERRIIDYLQRMRSGNWSWSKPIITIPDLCDMVVQPLSAMLSGSVAIVSVVVTGHVLKDVMHFLSRYSRKQRLDQALVCQVGHVLLLSIMSSDGHAGGVLRALPA